jgi:hypothetical protein
MSNISSVNLWSLSVFLRIGLRYSLLLSGSIYNISTYPKIHCVGVLSSWAAILIKSFWIWYWSSTAWLGWNLIYEAFTSLAMEDAGFYGMGIEYAKAMLGENIGGLYSYRRN